MQAYTQDGMRREKLAGIGRREYESRIADMARGPRIHGHFVIIPSHVYNADAADVWRRLGFRYDPDYRGSRVWRRDWRRPLPGYDMPHRPDVWLQSIRDRFYALFPKIDRPDVGDLGALIRKAEGRQYGNIAEGQTFYIQDPDAGDTGRAYIKGQAEPADLPVDWLDRAVWPVWVLYP